MTTKLRECLPWPLEVDLMNLDELDTHIIKKKKKGKLLGKSSMM